MNPKNQPLNNRERAYHHLRHAILIGEITYSNRLVDKDIALELGMSRMPVREALLQLRSEGFLESTYRGFILKAYSAENIFDIFAVRLLLDPEAAYQACQAATDFQLQSLEAASKKVALTDQQGLVKDNLLANWSFRRTWAQAVHNLTLKDTMDRLRDWAEQARIQALSDPDFRHGTAQRIQQITESFLNKDPHLAKQLVAENLIICRDKYCAIQAQLTTIHHN
ncbi:GntR family transcriptional regulator [Paenalcaligenes hominis]|uniref:GntR family transcriptional regulator n=1 Tax=Paenalcaligenes hominis TaxID=643674 RepID=UPI0035239C61